MPDSQAQHFGGALRGLRFGSTEYRSLELTDTVVVQLHKLMERLIITNVAFPPMAIALLTGNHRNGIVDQYTVVFSSTKLWS